MTNLARQLKAEFKRHEALCQKVLTTFHLLSNKARFRIVCLLVRDEFCVHDIAEVVGGCNVSNISQQLKILSLAGVVAKRRDQKRILYRLKNEQVRALIEFLQKQHLGKGP